MFTDLSGKKGGQLYFLCLLLHTMKICQALAEKTEWKTIPSQRWILKTQLDSRKCFLKELKEVPHAKRIRQRAPPNLPCQWFAAGTRPLNFLPSVSEPRVARGCWSNLLCSPQFSTQEFQSGWHLLQTTSVTLRVRRPSLTSDTNSLQTKNEVWHPKSETTYPCWTSGIDAKKRSVWQVSHDQPIALTVGQDKNVYEIRMAIAMNTEYKWPD